MALRGAVHPQCFLWEVVCWHCCLAVSSCLAAVFTVMCYNVLCDKYATRQVYGYCPSWALSWEYRRKGIMDEIRHYSADIISLQVGQAASFFFVEGVATQARLYCRCTSQKQSLRKYLKTAFSILTFTSRTIVKKSGSHRNVTNVALCVLRYT